MSAQHPTPLRAAQPIKTSPLRREQPIEKAARLISEDCVTPVPDARVYAVAGDTGTYQVVASPDGIFCPCPARTSLCAHVIAVAMVRQRGKVPAARLAKDLGVAS